MQRALLFRFATTDSLVSFTIPPTHETKFREFSLPHRPWLLDIPLGEQFYSDVRDAGCSPLSVLHTYDLRVKDTHYVVSHTRKHTHTSDQYDTFLLRDKETWMLRETYSPRLIKE